ncbi:hypothetical protein COV16_07475 [Candidatus Woesearchaeota archaeon CG10_big_fil_rev_8_21_14_0_10_34_8]|nr:MAG: hypothetical protein COV16_07475 [Candidatus Woesearchaeota archaeon CG10_big_fil_rev_8_21_14_0_10_34_8]
MIFNNLLVQILTLIAAIIASCIVSKLAEEELLQYTPLLKKTVKVMFVLTLISPVLFVEKILTIVFVALSYGVISFPQKNEIQTFYFLSPLTLFLATQNTNAFIITLSMFFIVTLLTTTLLLTKFVKKRIIWKKELFYSIARRYYTFVLISVLLYCITYFLS